MEVKRVIHKVWQEWEAIPQKLRDEMPIKQCIIGKYQYIYTQGKIRISLVKLQTIGWGRKGWQDFEWEICGGGLEDISRYATKKDAVKYIKKLMKENA